MSATLEDAARYGLRGSNCVWKNYRPLEKEEYERFEKFCLEMAKENSNN